jgi:CelD/BcsL family acetyltransferase involved in cellulose biosynthesis
MPDVPDQDCLEIEFICDKERFLALRAAWDELWRSAPGARLSQSFEWCRTAWEVRNWGPTAQLFVVAVRRRGVLVLVLPLVRERRLGVRQLRPLGPGGTEFSIALAAAGENEDFLLDQVIERVRQTRTASLLRLPFTPALSGAGRLVARTARKKLRGDVFASWVDWSTVANWDDFLLQRTGSGLLRSYRRSRRRLQELGELSFSRVEDAEGKAAALEWLFEKKVEWLSYKRLDGYHLALRDYREFVMRLCQDNNGLEVFCLKLNSSILAATLLSVGNNIWEHLIITYDRAYAKYSVGRLMVEDFMLLAFSEGMIVDLRIGEESWKKCWLTNDSRVLFADISLDKFGDIYLILERILATISYYRSLGVLKSLSRIRSRLIMRAGQLGRPAPGAPADA